MVQILLKHMWTQWYTEFWMIFLGIFCSFLYAAQRKRTTWKKGPKDGFWHSLNMFWFHVTRMYLENLGVSRVSVHLKTRLPLWCLLDGDLQLRCQCSQAFKTRNLPRYCWDCFLHTIRNKKIKKTWHQQANLIQLDSQIHLLDWQQVVGYFLWRLVPRRCKWVWANAMPWVQIEYNSLHPLRLELLGAGPRVNSLQVQPVPWRFLQIPRVRALTRNDMNINEYHIIEYRKHPKFKGQCVHLLF